MALTPARITRELADSNNEGAPGILTEAVDAAFAEAASSRLLLKPSRAMIQGLVSARPFALRSFVGFGRSALTLAEAGYAPQLIETEASPFLRLGSGSNLDPTHNGGLITPARYGGLSYGTGFTMLAAFRCPPGGGGAIIGNAVNQSRTYSTSANQRWSGLAVGWGNTVEAGSLRACLNGDNFFTDPPAAVDLRDNLWHVAVAVFDWTNQTLKVRWDGANEFSMSTWASGGMVRRDLSTVGGANRLRLGSAGFAEAAPEYQFVGDIGEVWVASAPLSGSALTDIEAALIRRFGLI